MCCIYWRRYTKHTDDNSLPSKAVTMKLKNRLGLLIAYNKDLHTRLQRALRSKVEEKGKLLTIDDTLKNTSHGKPTKIPKIIAKVIKATRERSSRELDIPPTEEENLYELDLLAFEVNSARQVSVMSEEEDDNPTLKATITNSPGKPSPRKSCICSNCKGQH